MALIKKDGEVKFVNSDGLEMLTSIDNERYFGAQMGMLYFPGLHVETVNGETKFSISLGEVHGDVDDIVYDYLMFENLGNGKIKEIISGVVFNLGLFPHFQGDRNENVIFNGEKTIEEFQQGDYLTEIRNFPLAITIHNSNYGWEEITKEYDEMEELEDEFFAFKIDDNFKNVYAERVLPKKEQIIQILRDAEKQGRIEVEDNINYNINRMHSIALTENELYDYEHRGLRK